jgi:hypothetical protein
MTINNLPDDVLVEMFRFYLVHFYRSKGWRGLVQVCQRWRNLVFEFPLHLGVKLHCTARTSLREMLDVWPPLPISIKCYSSLAGRSQVQHDAVLAILELHQRVCEIDLTGITNDLLEQVGQTMQKPFPALTDLRLESYSPSRPKLPNSFLGGSASRLRVLVLKHIPFPALPDLLLSTTHLQYLELYYSTYIPSQVMVTRLSGLTKLKTLAIKFYSTRFRHRPSPPSTRTLLPSLTHLDFQGRCDYLEDLVAGINAPLLKAMYLSFVKRDPYDTPQLFKFISRTNQLQSPRRVDVVLYDDHTIKVKVYLRTELLSESALELEILHSDGDLSPLAQLCHSSLSSLSALEHLYIRQGRFNTYELPNNIEDVRWLELLRRFSRVKHLYITRSLGPPVMSALAALAGDGVTVLPVLQNIFLEGFLLSGSLRDVVDQLIAARQVSGYSISAHNWETQRDMMHEMNSSTYA